MVTTHLGKYSPIKQGMSPENPGGRKYSSLSSAINNSRSDHPVNGGCMILSDGIQQHERQHPEQDANATKAPVV